LFYCETRINLIKKFIDFHEKLCEEKKIALKFIIQI
jgi:hypothetical protein